MTKGMRIDSNIPVAVPLKDTLPSLRSAKLRSYSQWVGCYLDSKTMRNRDS